ncbi:hypothetical protein Daus18300_004289 [Diaporthe australafricana]|uniref:Heterokaryon incompatibility domain-containing protein n=1 Tax=Diaporthe australafricana TaxID=127596 RepID=A0ABR3XAU5_9PEZI
MVVECSAERKELVTIHQFCPDRPYLELRIPDNAGSVKFVECALVGRDQGWYDHDEGPSYTWADAAIHRPPGRNDLSTLGIDVNTRGVLEFREHKRRWSLQAPAVRRVWGDLQAGDVIQLIPRANYPGWVNLVREARIKIGFEPAEDSDSNIRNQPTSAVSPILSVYRSRLDSKNREVRLLVVEPAASVDEPIVCSLNTSRLGDGPHFVALSYCWGPSHLKQRLTINDQSLEVSSSVVAALRRLRPARQALTIWIDQISINQGDAVERAEQVSIMSMIYSEAARVHIWLGEGDVVTRTSLRVVRDIYNVNHNICPGGDSCECEGTRHLSKDDALSHARGKDSPISRFMLEVLMAHVKNEHGELATAAGGVNNLQVTTFMTNLFLNPWFRRVWVLQEALLARSAVVHCGDELVTWEEVVQVSEWLGTITQLFYHVPHIIMPDIWSNVKSGDGGIRRMELLELFLNGLAMNATDPRDKLFALLSFAHETGAGHELPVAIKTSYEKEPSQVFADFTAWWIREHHSLSILSTVHGQRARTWQRLSCSDDRPKVERPTWAIGSEGQVRWAKVTLDSQFNFQASAGTSPDDGLLDEALSSSDLRLRLKGFQLTRIGLLFHLSLLGTKIQLGESEKEFLQILDMLFDMGGHHRTWNSKFKGLDWRPRPPPEDANEFVQCSYDHWRSHENYVQQQQPRRRRPTLGLPRIGPGNVVADRQLKAKEGYIPSCLDPVLFRADNGATGLCPWMAKEGDTIVVLHGAKVPYLLRPVEDEASGRVFELVGECYITSIMDGTWFSERVRAGVVPEVFTLV